MLGNKNDLLFMQEALQEAHKATALNEVPIGAVVVNPQGKIVGRGYNCVEGAKCQREHAEMRAIAQACKEIGDWRLDGHWIYITLEPCTMCMGLIKLSRLEGVVYGADSPLFGYRLDNIGNDQLYNDNTPIIISGVGQEESAEVLKRFFYEKRKKRE